MRISELDAQTLLVSDANTHKIVFVDKLTLEATGGFKVAGKPSGVLFADNRFFVGNSSNGSVEIFNTEGRIIGRLGQRGQFGQVNDLAINRDLGLIYVLDSKARQVFIFKLDGTAAGTVGSGVLLRPLALTVDELGQLIVSDFSDPVVGFRPGSVYLAIFNPAGVFSHSIVVGTVHDTTPQGLSTDSAGNVFMTDARSGSIKVFPIDGGPLLHTLGNLGVGYGELFYPLDVFVDIATNDVYVTDFNNLRITVFAGGGILP